MARLKTDKISIRYDRNTVVENLSLTIPDGNITTLIGPNGCGKSTILKALSRIMNTAGGAVYLDGKSIHKQSTRQIARRMAVLPQSPDSPEGLKVRELVSYGRYPHQSGIASLKKEDNQAIRWALRQTGLMELTERPIDTLSGGQRQRVWIAMALAQETDFLLLDEPTTYLDLAHQLEVLEVLQKLNEQENRTIIMVIHDLNHAARFSDYMVAIRNGAIMKEGEPEKVMRSDVLKDVFHIDAEIVPDPRNNKPVCITYDLLDNSL